MNRVIATFALSIGLATAWTAAAPTGPAVDVEARAQVSTVRKLDIREIRLENGLRSGRIGWSRFRTACAP